MRTSATANTNRMVDASSVGFETIPDIRIVDIEVVDERRVGFYERRVKRPIDIIGSGVLLFVLSPLIAAVAVGVRVSLGRPVLFRQIRITRDGRGFVMFKFRSMHPRSAHDACAGLAHTPKDSPRLTDYGRMMRDTSLDELPQLVNVLHGDMSLIGPRPEIKSVAESMALIDHPRHTVRPGMTGPWQVSVHRDGYVHDHVHLDEEYVDDLTLRRDVSIAWRTLSQIVSASFRCGLSRIRTVRQQDEPDQPIDL